METFEHWTRTADWLDEADYEYSTKLTQLTVLVINSIPDCLGFMVTL